MTTNAPAPRTVPRPNTGTVPGTASEPVVVLDKVNLAYDDHVVLHDLSFTVEKGSMLFILGNSGAGKSVTLKLILGLIKPDSGRIFVNGVRIDDMPERNLMGVRADIGMLFQETALFDSLTVDDNVGYRLYEDAKTPVEQIRDRVAEVLGFVGLAGYGDRMPSELSGGERRRVALARAMASRPSILLVDDPTTGLDPVTATSVDNEIVKLRDLEHVTSVVVTHQIRDARYVAVHEAVRRNGGMSIEERPGDVARHARFIVLHDGRIHFEGNLDQLLATQDPYLKRFMFRTLPPW